MATLVEYNSTGLYTFDVQPDQGSAAGGWAWNENFQAIGDWWPLLTAMDQYFDEEPGNLTLPGALSVSENTTLYGPLVGTEATFSGSITADTVAGDGSGITGLNASALSSGTVPVARLPESRVRLTSDVNTTLGTAVNVTGMAFSVGANETWTCEFYIRAGCTTGNGIKWAITIPSGATMVFTLEGTTGVGAATVVNVVPAGTVSGTLSSAINGTNHQGHQNIIRLSVTTGATPGTVQLQFAAATAGDTATCLTNSYLIARKH